jgi:phosphatidylglycerophosphatase A
LRLIKRKNPVNKYYKVPFLVNLLGSAFFIGHIPVASGTVGSLVGLGIYMLPHVRENLFLLVLIVFFFLAGVFVSEIMRKRYGEDPPQVIIDEVVGQWVTYLIGGIIFDLFFRAKAFDPQFFMSSKIVFAIIGFLLFRFFDIIKLQPCKYFDTKDSGWGIMMDDVAAGIYAGILAAPLTHFLWYRFLARVIFA